MFGEDNVQSVSFQITDPGADDIQFHVWRAPVACEILRGYIVSQVAQASGSAGAFTVMNWGTAGTAIKSSGGTIFATVGGTATASQLAAETPTALTVTEGTLAAGEWVVLDYQETGDWVETSVTITFDYVMGVGA